MKKRSPVAVFLLPFVTFGIYGIYWFVVTKNEMKKLGADIPTAWLIIVPLVQYWWLWKYSKGVEQVTGGKMSGVLSFLLFFFVGTIGSAIVQASFSEVGDTATLSPAAAAPVTEAEQAAPAPASDAPAPSPVTTPAAATAPQDVTPPQPPTNPQPPVVS